ncbi:MAG: cation diffusion facilitator family transporter [Rhodovibrionaceae bacterium]|nr:cation diffusion facilitator family transporter [Rhodovibrionaceae bacterium]
MSRARAEEGTTDRETADAPGNTVGPQRGGQQSERLLRMATYASVATALTLIVVKFGAWTMTESVSVLSTLIDSLLDAAASIVNLLAVRHALTPPDKEHRFGHGKAEPLAALGQATFICGSAAFLLIEAGQRLLDPLPVRNSAVGIGVMVFSIVATLLLVIFQRYVIRRTRSLAIQADSLHYVGDLLVNAAVIAAIVLAVQFELLIADPLFGIAIAFYILWNAWLIARGALDMLMDRELPEEDREKIKNIVREHPQVIGFHDLRTRVSGPKTFIQLHLELDGGLKLTHAHTIAESVEADLVTAFPDAEVIIHQDPHGAEGEVPHYG